jgi:hypothetical protein
VTEVGHTGIFIPKEELYSQHLRNLVSLDLLDSIPFTSPQAEDLSGETCDKIAYKIVPVQDMNPYTRSRYEGVLISA